MSFYAAINVFGISYFVRFYKNWAWRLHGCNKIIYFFERIYDIFFNVYWRQSASVSPSSVLSYRPNFLYRYLRLMIGRIKRLLQGIEETLIHLCMPFLVRLKLKRSGNWEGATLRGEICQTQYQW